MTTPIGLIPITFAGGFYKTRSKPLSSQTLVNWYLNFLDMGGLNEYCLYATPGLKQAVAAIGGINRGAWVMNQKPYFVNGNSLYRVDRSVDLSGNVTYPAVPIGTIVGTGRVIMDAIKSQLCILVPGVTAYIYVDGGALSVITDPDFAGPADDVVAVDSVFVFITTGTNVAFHSALNDGLNYSALDRYPVTQIPVAIGLIVYRNQLYVMGRNSIVPFTNVGSLQFLFAPQPNSVIPIGVRSKFLKSTFLDSYIFLGAGINGEISVWLYSGGSPKRLSTEPIDFIIQNATDEEIDRAFILRHSQNSADFAVLNIGNYCFTYDLTASSKLGEPLWHERKSRIEVDDAIVEIPWRPTSIVQAYNRVFVGDSVDGTIGEIADDIGNEYGNPIPRVLDTQPLSNNGIQGIVKGIEVFTDVGVSENDVMSLSWSGDGGFTYGNKLERSLGEIGEYGRRVFWSRLGSFSIARTLRFEYSGEYPRGINKIMANVA